MATRPGLAVVAATPHATLMQRLPVGGSSVRQARDFFGDPTLVSPGAGTYVVDPAAVDDGAITDDEDDTRVELEERPAPSRPTPQQQARAQLARLERSQLVAQLDKFGAAGKQLRDLTLFASIALTLVVVALALLSIPGGYDFVPTALFTRFSVVPLLFLLLQPVAAIPLLLVQAALWPVVCLVYASLCCVVAVVTFVGALLQTIAIVGATVAASAVQQFGTWIALFGGAVCLVLQVVVVVLLATLVYHEHGHTVARAVRKRVGRRRGGAARTTGRL